MHSNYYVDYESDWFSQEGKRMKHIMFEPEIYQYTMKKMKADPKKCLVVEDSTYGITAAKAAGAIVIGREDERFGYDQSGADYLIKRLTEIIKIIEGGVS